jgi:baculoviral IAP repeat-containing protein 2/3
MSSQPAHDALQMGLNAGRVRVVMQRRLQMTGRPFTSTEALVAAVLDGQIEDEGFEQDPETEGQIESQVTELLLSAVNSVAFSGTDVVERPSTSTTRSAQAPLSNVRPIVPDNRTADNSLTRTTTELLRPSAEMMMQKLPTQLNETPPATASTAEDSDERRLKNVECKICMTEEVGVVFLPCGHLLSCVYCAPALAQCPLCRETIVGRVRTFLS